ncbi:hypothetical protein PoB_003546700 [Plakobranchus ocellatus]|uniref:Uncharacterized protein n=1 Tax=Plakobranchus ocellatus TaxID=259542 RepID=A0AAV4ANV8_9GAST|nr:hypothetical protein PoB_003546700 [Plakobranchus ocellatus]
MTMRYNRDGSPEILNELEGLRKPLTSQRVNQNTASSFSFFLVPSQEHRQKNCIVEVHAANEQVAWMSLSSGRALFIATGSQTFRSSSGEELMANSLELKSVTGGRSQGGFADDCVSKALPIRHSIGHTIKIILFFVKTFE